MDNIQRQIPELLFFSEGNQMTLVSHVHSFYQLEICIRGELRGIGDHGTHRLLPGNYWLIPPETSHRFVSYDPEVEYFSLKFNSAFPVPECWENDDFTCYQIAQLRQLLNKESPVSPYSDTGKKLIEYQLFVLISHLATTRPRPENSPSRFIMRLKEEISIQGYRINVNELVELHHCTRNQFRYRFMQEHGGPDSVKEFIDQTLFEIAQNHLKFTDKNFTVIAGEMNFPSLAVFSRFIHRMCGQSPRELRRQIRSKQK